MIWDKAFKAGLCLGRYVLFLLYLFGTKLKEKRKIKSYRHNGFLPVSPRGDSPGLADWIFLEHGRVDVAHT